MSHYMRFLTLFLVIVCTSVPDVRAADRNTKANASDATKVVIGKDSDKSVDVEAGSLGHTDSKSDSDSKPPVDGKQNASAAATINTQPTNAQSRDEVRIPADRVLSMNTSLESLRRHFEDNEKRQSEGLGNLVIVISAGVVIVSLLLWTVSRKQERLRKDFKYRFEEFAAGISERFQKQTPQMTKDFSAELNAKNSELRQLKLKSETIEEELRRSRSAAGEAQVKVDEAKAQLQAAEARGSQLKEDVARLRSDLESARAEFQSSRAEVMTLRSALIPASPAGLVSTLGDELVAALRGNSPHAVSLLGCLGMIKSADAAGMEEEVLLSTIRQFSESFASHYAGKGTSAEVIHQGLVAWADALNAQFPGKLEIRVPALGFPVDSRTMTALRGATKVSSVLSWCIYNSQGSVFAPAKVA